MLLHSLLWEFAASWDPICALGQLELLNARCGSPAATTATPGVEPHDITAVVSQGVRPSPASTKGAVSIRVQSLLAASIDVPRRAGSRGYGSSMPQSNGVSLPWTVAGVERDADGDVEKFTVSLAGGEARVYALCVASTAGPLVAACCLADSPLAVTCLEA